MYTGITQIINTVNLCNSSKHEICFAAAQSAQLPFRHLIDKHYSKHPQKNKLHLRNFRLVILGSKQVNLILSISPICQNILPK